MTSLVYLIPLALILGAVALAIFFWSMRSGQYEDLEGAAARIFVDEDGDRADASHTSSAHASPTKDPSGESPEA